MCGSAGRPGSLTTGRLLPKFLLIALMTLAFVFPTRTNLDAVTIEISPSTVNVNPGQQVSLDIRLNNADGARVVAWETHFTASNGSVVQFLDGSDARPGEPVQEQPSGSTSALNNLTRLAADGSNETTAQYFTAQNQ